MLERIVNKLLSLKKFFHPKQKTLKILKFSKKIANYLTLCSFLSSKIGKYENPSLPKIYNKFKEKWIV